MKIKKHLLISTALFLTLTVGYGQTNIYHPFPDSNSTWVFHFTSYHPLYPVVICPGTTEDYYSLVISGDTLIGSQIYHKLNVSAVQIISTALPCGNTNIGYRGAIRQDIPNKKVFIIPPSSSTEQLLYDFNLQVGDTLKGYIGANINALPYADIVDSIDSVLVGSNYHKRWKIRPCNPPIDFLIEIIEGVGSTYGLIKESPCNKTDQPYYYLNCFKQNDIILYPNAPTNCNIINSVNSIEKNSNTIEIFPNPFSTQTTLRTEKLLINASVTVFNSVGQTVKRIDNLAGQTIVFNRDNLPSGLYFVRLTEENKIIAVDKLVITDK